MNQSVNLLDLINDLNDGSIFIIDNKPKNIIEMPESILIVKSYFGREFPSSSVKVIPDFTKHNGVAVFSLTLRLGETIGATFTLLFNVLTSESDVIIGNLANQKHLNIVIADSSNNTIQEVTIENTLQKFATDYLTYKSNKTWNMNQFINVCMEIAQEINAKHLMM